MDGRTDRQNSYINIARQHNKRSVLPRAVLYGFGRGWHHRLARLGGVAVRAAWLRIGESGFEAQAGRIIVSGYSGVCFEIKFSGRHRWFDGVLFNL